MTETDLVLKNSAAAGSQNLVNFSWMGENMRTIKVGLCGIAVVALCGVRSYGQAQGGGQRGAAQPGAQQGGEQHPAVPGVADTTPPKDRGAYFTAADVEN